MKKETASRAKGGKRVQRGSRLPLLLVAVVAVLAAIFAAYFLTSDQNALPAAYVQIPGQSEPLDLGGMTPDEAAQALTEAAQVGEERSVTLTCAGQTLTIPAASFQPNVQELISQIQSGGESQTWQLTYTVQGMDSQLAALAEQTSVAPIDPVYTVGEETVEVVMGTPGAALDPEAATAAILEAFYACQATVELAPQAVDPAPSPLRTSMRPSMWPPLPPPPMRMVTPFLPWWASPSMWRAPRPCWMPPSPARR